jgi:hypothetical protein
MEQEIKNLPGELDSIVARLDQAKLRSLGFRLNQDFNKLLDQLFAPQRMNALLFPFIFMPDGLNGPLYRRITQEDLSRWRDAHKSEIRVVVGKGGVGVIAISELARKYKVTVPQITLIAQEQGYTVLGWDGYQNLLDEIGKLISRDEEQGGITRSSPAIGIPLPIHSTEKVKVLPKSSPL